MKKNLTKLFALLMVAIMLLGARAAQMSPANIPALPSLWTVRASPHR